MRSDTPCIFVVDDEPLIVETLTIILQREGFVVKGFTNPQEALVAACHEAPDLLLTDVIMPQLLGVDLAVSILKCHPSCKILLFSGQAETVDLLSRVHEQGYGFEILSKPIHPVDLLRRIRKEVVR